MSVEKYNEGMNKYIAGIDPYKKYGGSFDDVLLWGTEKSWVIPNEIEKGDEDKKESIEDLIEKLNSLCDERDYSKDGESKRKRRGKRNQEEKSIGGVWTHTNPITYINAYNDIKSSVMRETLDSNINKKNPNE